MVTIILCYTVKSFSANNPPTLKLISFIDKPVLQLGFKGSGSGHNLRKADICMIEMSPTFRSYKYQPELSVYTKVSGTPLGSKCNQCICIAWKCSRHCHAWVCTSLKSTLNIYWLSCDTNRQTLLYSHRVLHIPYTYLCLFTLHCESHTKKW